MKLSPKTFLPIITVAAMFFMAASPLLADLRGYLDAEGNWRFDDVGGNTGDYRKAIRQASKEFEVESALIAAVIKAESDFNHKAVSKKGAKGLMQLMPDTASMMNLEEPFSPNDNISAGVHYLSILLDRFKNNKTLALAAYNAGPETVEAYGGVPPYRETKDFISKVLYYYKRYAYMN
jgi:soluble lytic murein transglycosylase-like protein